MRDWVTNVEDTFYIIGTVAGPHPYPMMVRDFHRVIGREVREQILAREKPDVLLPTLGGQTALNLAVALARHGALARQYDRGFLWWDPVHPTSLGHRLIAETFLPEVLELAGSP